MATQIVKHRLAKRFGHKIAAKAAKLAKKAGKKAVKKTIRKEARIASKHGELVKTIFQKLQTVGKKVEKQIYKEARGKHST